MQLIGFTLLNSLLNIEYVVSIHTIKYTKHKTNIISSAYVDILLSIHRQLAEIIIKCGSGNCVDNTKFKESKY